METLLDCTVAGLRVLSVNDAVSGNMDPDKVNDAVSESMDEDKVVECIEAHNPPDDEEDDLYTVSKIHKTHRYIDIMQKAEKMPELFSTRGLVLEEDAVLQLIADCSSLARHIYADIIGLYEFIRSKLHSRFPTLVVIGIDMGFDSYARLVKTLGNGQNGVLRRFRTSDVLRKASPTSGNPIPDEVPQIVFDACDRLLVLDSAQSSVSAFVGKIAEYIAPNLCALLGPYITPNLIMKSGGLSALANIPADNFNLLGPKKITNSKRFFAEMPQFDLLKDTVFLNRVHHGLKFNTYRFVGGAVRRAASVDCKKGDPTGDTGRCMREKILGDIERWNKEPYYGSCYKVKKPKRFENRLTKPKEKKRTATLKKLMECADMAEMQRLGIVAYRGGERRQDGRKNVSSSGSCTLE